MIRVMGLDVGEVRIGVALSDPLGITAQRLAVIERTGSAEDMAALRRLAEQHGVTSIVVGLPLTMRGERGPQAQKVLAFADTLRTALDLPVELIDERLTTVQGARALRETGMRSRKQKTRIDQVAAQLILQQFLDARPRETQAE
jgi:putative Holliday junction resolvase